MTVEPFELHVAEAQLDDLRDRLRRTRWPEPATAPGWTQGVPLERLQAVCATWAEDYDWRATERRLNAIGQFHTELDGLGIHFLHARSPHPGALPLIMTHGWPGSVIEYLGRDRSVLDPAGGPGGRLPRRLPLAAGLRFQREAVRAGVGRRADRRRVGAP